MTLLPLSLVFGRHPSYALVKTSSYSPNSAGIIEHSDRMLNEIIAKHVNTTERWSSRLGMKSATSATLPSQILFGIERHLPFASFPSAVVCAIKSPIENSVVVWVRGNIWRRAKRGIRQLKVGRRAMWRRTWITGITFPEK